MTDGTNSWKAFVRIKNFLSQCITEDFDCFTLMNHLSYLTLKHTIAQLSLLFHGLQPKLKLCILVTESSCVSLKDAICVSETSGDYVNIICWRSLNGYTWNRVSCAERVVASVWRVWTFLSSSDIYRAFLSFDRAADCRFARILYDIQVVIANKRKSLPKCCHVITYYKTG